MGKFRERYDLIDIFVERLEKKLDAKLPSADKEMVALYRSLLEKLKEVTDSQKEIKTHLQMNKEKLSLGSQKQLDILLMRLSKAEKTILSIQGELKHIGQTQQNLISDVSVDQFRKLKERRLEKQTEMPPQTFNSSPSVLVNKSRRMQKQTENDESRKENNLSDSPKK